MGSHRPRQRPHTLFLAGLCCLLAAKMGHAGELRWTYHGPFGGFVTALAIDPNQTSTVYVATLGGGVFRSDDGGETWERKSSGLGRRLEVTDLTLGPGDPATVHISTSPFGLFTSADRGESWTELSTSGLPTGLVGAHKMVAHPTDALRLWAAVEANTSGIYRSLDGGATWSLSTSTLTPMGRGSFLLLDRSDPQVLYSSNSAQLIRSLDGGASWAAIATSITGSNFYALAIDPSDPQSIVVSQNGRLARSPDRGATFPDLLSFPGTPATSIVFDPTDSNTFYVATESRGLYKTTNGGATLPRLNDPVLKEQYGVLVMEPGNPTALYAGAHFDGGVFKSTNAGMSWVEKNQGLVATRVRAVAVAPSNTQVVYCGTTGNGVFKSLDGGGSWARTGSGLPSAGEIYSLLVDPGNADTVYAGTNYHVYGSLDGGASWTQLHPNLLSQVHTLLFDPPSLTKLLAATDHSSFQGIYRSLDSGASWSATATSGLRPQGTVETLALDAQNPLRLYADSGREFEGILRSVDGGATWAFANNGINLPTTREIRALMVCPSSSSTLVAATSLGVYHSTDGADSWQRTDPGASGFNGVAAICDPVSGQTTYVARYSTTQTQINKVTNNGASWTDLAEDASGAAILTLALDPVDGSTLFAGTSGSGVGVLNRVDQILFADGFESGDTSRWSLVVE